MSLFLWISVLLVAILAAHWGADQLSAPLEKLRMQWGFSEAGGVAFVALATASPEIGTNTASALQGLSDIGLGNLMGSNIISVPAIVAVSYFAAQSQPRPEQSSDADQPSDRDKTTEPRTFFSKYRSLQALRIKREALTVQVIPYLAVILLAAILTIPPAWRGLQPIDGWIMLGAYVIYVGQALLRKREQRQDVTWRTSQLWKAGGGVLALAIGAYFIVAATEQIVSILGISELVGGLFITSTLSIAPEVFATWSIARSGQVTAATTSVIADNMATLTLAFFPLALVGLPIENGLLFGVNLAFVAILGILYALFIQLGEEQNSFELWEVGVLIGTYLFYVAIMVFVIL